MRLRKMMRGASARLAPLLVAGALVLGVAQGTNDGPQEVHNWSQAQATYVAQGPRGLSMRDAPDPPSTVVLVEASSEGSALGLEISALAQHLGGTIVEGSAPNGEETLETFHEVICFAISWLRENRVDPGDPREMARTIDVYLVASDLPRLDYPRARKDLEKLYVTFKRASSTDELAREVAEAILC
jgi:hypothetical protein